MTDDSNQHSLFPGNDSPDPIDETYLNQQARRITESDIRRVTDRADEIRSRIVCVSAWWRWHWPTRSSRRARSRAR